MTAYNPFKKAVGQQLDINDLNDLIANSVAEGFYIEYKSTFVKPEKIARSIASFANTYGGWYFVGVEANKQNGNVATRICGFEISHYQDPIAKILDPVRQRLSHMPLMLPQLINIDATNAVIAVYIPEGLETPYITSEGTIYRRAADASDPVGESNRYTVDRLVDRGREEEKAFADFCKDHREFNNNENTIPWLSIYCRPKPRRNINLAEFLTSENIQKLISKSKQPVFIMGTVQENGISSNGPLNIGYLSGTSIVLRQDPSTHSVFNSLTVQIFADGSTKIHIPIQVIGLPPLDRFDIHSPEVCKFLQAFIQETVSILVDPGLINLGSSLLAGAILTAYL
jgi:hypothetical protein